MSSQSFLTLPVQTPESDNPEGAELLNGAVSKLGFQPNMYGVMANMPALLKTYLQGYADFRATGGFAPA